jgi:hypothetical protein
MFASGNLRPASARGDDENELVRRTDGTEMSMSGTVKVLAAPVGVSACRREARAAAHESWRRQPETHAYAQVSGTASRLDRTAKYAAERPDERAKHGFAWRSLRPIRRSIADRQRSTHRASECFAEMGSRGASVFTESVIV